MVPTRFRQRVDQRLSVESRHERNSSMQVEVRKVSGRRFRCGFMSGILNESWSSPALPKSSLEVLQFFLSLSSPSKSAIIVGGKRANLRESSHSAREKF